MNIRLGRSRPAQRNRLRAPVAAAVGIAAVCALVLGYPLSASAASYWTWYHGTRIPQDVWHSVSTGATYDGARVISAYADAQALYSMDGSTFRAPGEVDVSFSYRAVKAKCEWDSPLFTIDDLFCELKY